MAKSKFKDNAATFTLFALVLLGFLAVFLAFGLEGLRSIFIVFDIILFLALIYAMHQAVPYRPDLIPRPKKKQRVVTLAQTKIGKQWQEITAKLKEGSPDNLRESVLTADQLVDNILKQIGYQGEHMADRLEKIGEGGFMSSDRLWRAHRIRNEVLHSPDFELPRTLAERTIEDYAAFLREIKVLG
ncbi:MAG: hypothetical protein HY978_02900 [Candidatus Liptonbacteria bacterium]|nr:hypothetical protein [Candidatus Liptonbacteria bacterium]